MIRTKEILSNNNFKNVPICISYEIEHIAKKKKKISKISKIRH